MTSTSGRRGVGLAGWAGCPSWTIACGKQGRSSSAATWMRSSAYLDGLVEIGRLQPLEAACNRTCSRAMPAISQSRGRSPWVSRTAMRGRLPGALAVVGGRRHADVEGRDCCVRQRRHELRGDQPVAGAPRVQPGGQLAAPVAVGPLHAVALGDQLGEPVALVVVEDLQPRALGVRAGAQLVGQAGGQRAVDEAVAVGAPQLDRGCRRRRRRAAGAAVQMHGGQQVGIARVGQ